MFMAHSKSVLFKMAQALLQQANFQIDKTLLSEDQIKKEPQDQIFITCHIASGELKCSLTAFTTTSSILQTFLAYCVPMDYENM